MCTATPTAASAPRPSHPVAGTPWVCRPPVLPRNGHAMTSSGLPPGSGPALVEVTGVDKRFGTTRALRGVGLSLRARQCLGLVGRNGAGKSTLVSILSGLIEPDAGTVRFGGEPAPRVGDVG